MLQQGSSRLPGIKPEYIFVRIPPTCNKCKATLECASGTVLVDYRVIYERTARVGLYSKKVKNPKKNGFANRLTGID